MLNNNSLMDEVTPFEFFLSQNYPNPFKEKTVIKYCVAYKTRVQIIVYDHKGNEIEKLVHEEKQPGTYEIKFSSLLDHSGNARNLSNGYYFYRMFAGDFSSEKKWLCINNLLRSNTMKTFLHTLFLFLLVTQICFAQWYEQNSGTTQNLNGVFFMDANNGLVIGDSGILIRTTNSGVDWELIPSGVSNDLTAMCFTDANNGWIVSDGLNTLGDSSVILHTTNGGLNWTKQWTVGRSTLSDIFFVDQQVGFTVGYVAPGGWEYSILLKTSDGGLTWTQLNYDSLNVPRQINFFDSNTGWLSWGGCAQGCWGGINKTTDGGATWFRKRGGYWKDIQFTDSNNAIAVSTGSMMEEQWGVVTKTTDGGETWSSQIIYAPGECLDLGFESIFSINNSIAVILGVLYGNCGGVICYWSTDGGATWIPQPTGIEQNMNRMFFTNELNGWIIGDNGTIFHTTNGGVSFVEEEQINEIPTEFLLSNNYPNPFNPSTTIRYSIPTQSNVVIKVFDVLGNEIETLVNEEKHFGTYEITWYATNLPSGVYFYQIRAGNFVETKKMLLLK